MGITIQIAQLLLSLGLLVIVHELGHFLAARAFKARVDKFYLFFNPLFSIIRAKRVNKKWRLSWFSPAPPKEWAENPDNTEWGVGWVPLGGYCKIAGMIDESMDTETMKQPMQAWEFRAKPAWQRLIIITGGVLVNFVTALAIYAMILYAWGKEYIPIANATYGYDYCQTALNNGFVGGDVILAVNGKAPERLGEAVEQILYADGEPVTLLRAGDTVQLTLPADFSQQLLAANGRYFAQERIPFVVEMVTGGSPAAAAGLQSGDSIVGINGAHTLFFAQLSDSLLRYAGKPIVLNFFRNGELRSQEVTPTENGKLGVGRRSPLSFFKTKKLEYGFFESIPAGIVVGTETLVSYVKQFKIIFTKEGAKNLGGFGAIGSLFDTTWNWAHFWSMTAFLSIILAFLNILPIPAFDGGHMIFILYEMVSGRKPSDKFLERSQMVGLAIIVLLFVFANGNDIMRWLATR
ncbi:MAG: RIP metalloprotease RseP [Prevotellaceae bacterium]|jgi:regulator of sigma E protease|nr:RIP metalloprotease RseP [Prevotellaceae bacterium]